MLQPPAPQRVLYDMPLLPKVPATPASLFTPRLLFMPTSALANAATDQQQSISPSNAQQYGARAYVCLRYNGARFPHACAVVSQANDAFASLHSDGCIVSHCASSYLCPRHQAQPNQCYPPASILSTGTAVCTASNRVSSYRRLSHPTQQIQRLLPAITLTTGPDGCIGRNCASSYLCPSHKLNKHSAIAIVHLAPRH